MDQSDLLASGRSLPVMEEFYSLQGEGFHTGEAAWFIRIGGCDVGCAWCDIKESWNADLFPLVETDKVIEKALQSPSNSVIVTGGEPLQYNLNYLCEQLKAQGTGHRTQGTGHTSGIRTFLETSGSQPLSGIWDWICLSPKRDWPPREEFYVISHELKVIIHEETDFEWAEEQAAKMNRAAHLFLQPEWSHREEMLPRIIIYIQTHPKWRLSLQAHKYIGIP